MIVELLGTRVERLRPCVAALLCVFGGAATACSGSDGEQQPEEIDGSGPSTPITPSAWTLGGSASGLVDATVVLVNTDGQFVTVTQDGPFAFASAIAGGSDYAVTLAELAGSQICAVQNGTGVAQADVTTIAVLCDALPTPPAVAVAYGVKSYEFSGPP